MPESVAIVTGGARGIGLATCHSFREKGHQVALADLDEQAARSAAFELDSSGWRVLPFHVDVSSTDSVNSMVAGVTNALGRIDLLVNNAGISHPVPSQEMSDDEWERMLDVHLGGTFRCSRAVFPSLCVSPSAAIVNLSSVAAQIALPRRLSYSAAKGGIEALTRTLAVEWAPYGIRVNAVAPGHTRTPLVAAAFASGSVQEDTIVARVPLGRLAEPRDIAEAISYLASPEASFVTGQVLVVDGGMSINSGV